MHSVLIFYVLLKIAVEENERKKCPEYYRLHTFTHTVDDTKQDKVKVVMQLSIYVRSPTRTLTSALAISSDVLLQMYVPESLLVPLVIVSSLTNAIVSLDL